MVRDHVFNKYSNYPYHPRYKCVKPICEENCHLTDVTPSNYLILDGDEIEKCNNPSTPQKSSDCIILKNTYHEKVLIVELRNRRKATDLSELKAKFKTSTKEILDTLSEVDEDPKIYLLFLGRLENSAKKSKKREFLIRGKYCYIENKECGYSVLDIDGFVS